jgi:hypothetical protein
VEERWSLAMRDSRGVAARGTVIGRLTIGEEDPGEDRGGEGTKRLSGDTRRARGRGNARGGAWSSLARCFIDLASSFPDVRPSRADLARAGAHAPRPFSSGGVELVRASSGSSSAAGYRQSHQKMSTRLSPRRMSAVMAPLRRSGRAGGPSGVRPSPERRFAWRRRSARPRPAASPLVRTSWASEPFPHPQDESALADRSFEFSCRLHAAGVDFPSRPQMSRRQGVAGSCAVG